MKYSTKQILKTVNDLYELADDVVATQEDTDWDILAGTIRVACDEIKNQVDDSDEETTKSRVHTLFEAIAHGDDKHKAWLEKAIKQHFAGQPVDRQTE